MHDSVEGNDTGGGRSRKPPWWNESVDSSWSRAKAETIHDWDRITAGKDMLERGIEHEAVAFGYGARRALQSFKAWGAEVEGILAADWKATGRDAHAAWDKVKGAVKHGWDRATGGAEPTLK